ncbi:MAG: diguanylate cyclase [Gammaproteobacteria bacterium]
MKTAKKSKLLIPGIESSRDIYPITQNILNKITQISLRNDADSYLTASVGVSIYPLEYMDADQLLANADEAMYQAKNVRKNQFCIFNEACLD